ncbi:hypothetical protein NDU88_004412 [Pleurodeles waltl]|uniref:Uncharacterized protein n=1 Tax=Pleurodeles waltl TaxID=8319 RepID=A0AAV7QBV7_PLEWA|nr:hypothetical protein NDU88_004412 [Pleurodeles waltl]
MGRPEETIRKSGEPRKQTKRLMTIANGAGRENYTATVQRQRASSPGVKNHLHQAGLTYFLLFPARLKVIANGTSFFFIEPTDAWDWVVQRRYEVSKPSAPNVPQYRPQRRKQNRMAPQEPGMDRVKGAPSPVWARLEQKRAPTAATALWMDKVITMLQVSNGQCTDLESEASVSETPSDTLTEVTTQTADMLL